MKRYLALDVGTKTIGIAVSDAMGWTAQGVTTLQRKNYDADAAEISKIIREYEATGLVIGLPLSMNGDEGTQAQFVKKTMDELLKRLPPIDAEYWDERLSTVAAERSLLEADLSREKRKKVINKMAAVFILQGYLDSKSYSITGDH